MKYGKNYRATKEEIALVKSLAEEKRSVFAISFRLGMPVEQAKCLLHALNLMKVDL